jgi:N-acetylneuraminate lyase
MVGGTTGESTSFSTAERLEAVKAWLAIADNFGLSVYVHVGMGSIQEAAGYTAAVALLPGVKGIFCMPSVYFKPSTIPNLVDTMAIVAAGAPDLPFWYYHFPAKTMVDFNMF